VLALRSFTSYSSSDYNGFRVNPGAEYSFEWDTPAGGARMDYEGKLDVHRFRTLRDYSETTGQDRHSVPVDFGVFVKVRVPDKADPQHLYNPEDFDFSLKRRSAAIDAGIELPTITDGFTGKAPDLGAYERGRAIPHYGPRVWPVGSRQADAPRSVRGPVQ